MIQLAKNISYALDIEISHIILVFTQHMVEMGTSWAIKDVKLP